MKYLIIVLIACLVASSSASATSRQLPAIETVAISNQGFLDIVSSVSSLTEQLVAQASQLLGNLLRNANSAISNASNELQEGIANANKQLNEFIQSIENQIQQIGPCFEEARSKYHELRLATRAALKGCHVAGRQQLESIRGDLQNYHTINREAIERVRAKIQVCVNLPSLGDRIQCALDAARIAGQSINEIRENIASTARTIAGKVSLIVDQTNQCVEGELQTSRQQVIKITEETRQCIEDSEGSGGSGGEETESFFKLHKDD